MPFFENYGTDFAMEYGTLSKSYAIASMHLHPHYEVLLFTKPVEQISIVNGKEIPVISEPSMTVFSPFCMHQTHTIAPNPIDRAVFYFGETLIGQHPYVFEYFRPYEKTLYSRFILSPSLLTKIAPLWAYTRSFGDRSVQAKLNFLLLFTCILTEAEPESSMAKGDSHIGMESIIQYMAEHSHENLTAEQVCQHFFISRSKLNKDFQKYMPVTFHRLLTDIKISQACYMLQTKDADIKAIATALGFEEETYFYTFFKKETGLTPLQYRKQRRPLFLARK